MSTQLAASRLALSGVAPADAGRATRARVALWLNCLCALIVAMIAVGGVTRLTNSGLSIVEWKPLMGAIPPLGDQAWQEAFDKYRQYPQFRILNPEMTIEGFKTIFFWEYFHRLLGRLIGVAFFVPWAWFMLRGGLDRRLSLKLGAGFLLGGLQGALGWFMVKSGLVDQPHVSHYRLAAHLSVALGVLAYLFWLALDLRAEARAPAATASRDGARLKGPLAAVSALLALQILYGAFTAGLKAGFACSTFPSWNGQWFPLGFFVLDPAWRNWLENPTAVQFIHRVIGASLALSLWALWARSRKLELSARQRLALGAMAGWVLAQFALGVATVVLRVPVAVAALHQLGACALFLLAVWANHAAREGARRSAH